MTTITTKKTTDFGFYYELTDAKGKTISLSICKGKNYFQVTVNVRNSMQKVWRSFGKVFNSFEEAFGNYKSEKMKDAISTAHADYLTESI
jgi:hypothetical protein